MRAAEAAIDPDALADAHARYAAERDAAMPADHAGPRPTGGVGGTREGVKCLHAHYAWYLAGGDDPVGRWVADQLAGDRSRPATPSVAAAGTLAALLDDDVISIGPVGGPLWPLATGPRVLIAEVADRDPPSPGSLTNAIGMVTDDLDDVAARARRGSVAGLGGPRPRAARARGVAPRLRRARHRRPRRRGRDRS